MSFRSWALNKYTEAVSGLYLTSFWLLFVHLSYIMVTFNLSITYSYYNTLIYSKTYQYLCLIWSHNWNCQFCFWLAWQNGLWRQTDQNIPKFSKQGPKILPFLQFWFLQNFSISSPLTLKARQTKMGYTSPPSSRHFFNPPPIGLKFIKNHLKKVDKWSSWYISDVTKSSQNLQFFSQRVCNEPMFAPKKNLTYVLYVFICISYRNLCFQCFMSVFIWSIATKVNEAGVRYILILLYFSLSTLFLNEEHDTIVIQSGSR